MKVRDNFLFNKPQRFAYSDASAAGCGSVISPGKDCVCHKPWEPSECSKSSTWGERASIVFALESFAPVLKGSLVKWFTDSQTASRIIEVGSMKLEIEIEIEIEICTGLLLKYFIFARSTVFVWRWSGFHVPKMGRQITSVGL